MNPIVKISEDKCKICYTCVRECPVKAIKVTSGGQVPEIISERCIACGTCVNACSPLAITYRSDKEIVKELLTNHPNVVASVDPTIASEFHDITDYRKFVRMLKQLGFKQAYEVSFGVDLVAHQYKKMVDNFRGKYFITANCPVVVAYIEKFHPDLVNNIAPIVSPMIAMARVIRKKIKSDVKIVHIGPCIGAKDEALKYPEDKTVDAVLTFLELRELFDEYSISESTLEYSHITEPFGYMGSLYPISNGIIQAAKISENLLENTIITGDGKTPMVLYMKAFEKNIDAINSHFNMFFCKGCIMGPGTSKGQNRLERRTLVVEYANKRIETLDKANWEDNIKKYSDIDFSRNFETNFQRLPEPSPEKITEILRSIEIIKPEDEVDCGKCGFTTCKEFATAVAKGLTIPEMCITFSYKNQQNYIKSLKASNENLAHIQAALKESERQAHAEHDAAKEASETTTAMLQKLRAGIVFIDKNFKVIQTNDSFIDMLGEDVKEINEIVPGLIGADIKSLLPSAFSNIVNFVLNSNEEVSNRDVQSENGLLNISVFPIKKGKIVGAILRDLYQPEVRKAEVISRVSEVIDKNLEMVQKIGFLLGEGASETEKMLNSIIQSYKPKEEK